MDFKASGFQLKLRGVDDMDVEGLHAMTAGRRVTVMWPQATAARAMCYTLLSTEGSDLETREGSECCTGDERKENQAPEGRNCGDKATLRFLKSGEEQQKYRTPGLVDGIERAGRLASATAARGGSRKAREEISGRRGGRSGGEKREREKAVRRGGSAWRGERNGCGRGVVERRWNAME